MLIAGFCLKKISGIHAVFLLDLLRLEWLRALSVVLVTYFWLNLLVVWDFILGFALAAAS